MSQDDKELSGSLMTRISQEEWEEMDDVIPEYVGPFPDGSVELHYPSFEGADQVCVSYAPTESGTMKIVSIRTIPTDERKIQQIFTPEN